jgi:hypothetical protein
LKSATSSTRWVQSSVFGWETSGVEAVALVIVGVLTLDVVAALAPAGRAARIDPAISPRE